MPQSIWMSSEVLAALVGVAVGFLLTLGSEWWRNRARRRAHWAALSAEIDFCRDLASTYLRDNVAAPLYRLPTAAYSNAFPALLATAALTESDTRALLSFFNEVETLNRGLDQVAGTEQDGIRSIYERNRMKAERLVPACSHGYYDGARAVVDSRRRWYKP